MRQSILFTKTKKEVEKNEVSQNARLLLRGGYINKEMAGVYSFLPLGLRVIRKIENVIREEMKNSLGAQEIVMPALHPLSNYKKTGREKIDVLFHTKLNSGGDLVLGQSHEEIVVPLFKKFVSSYKDLPCGIFQIQTKFRNELRAKSGILRGREFLMKDLYSFHENENSLHEYYERVKEVYLRIYKRLGIGEKTYITLASGGTFSKYSHEFQTITNSGEDDIYLCKDCKIAINKEIIETTKRCPKCKKDISDLEEKKAIEVGNIFPLYTRFSKPFGLTYKDKEGKENLVVMGCYGIGISRVMGAVVEVLSDERGIVWPKNIAPFSVHLLSLNADKEAEKLYNLFLQEGIDILFDDREKRPGEKLIESDLLGIPLRIVVSGKTLEKDSVEIKKREKEEEEFVKINEVIKYVQKNI